MRKPTICIGENKDSDQLHGNCEANQHLCFRYSESTIPLLLTETEIFMLLAVFCGYVGPLQKPHCWFSHEAAQLISN